jgi:isoleucyl-tRNA synthetase
MATVQRVVRLGHAARNAHGLKTRQPLSAVTLVSADETLPDLVAPYADLLRDELNVQEIRWAEDRSAYVHHTVKPNYKLTGRRFGKRMKEVAGLLAAADGDALAAELEESGAVTIRLADGPETLSPEELDVRLEEREGTATQGDRELLVALSTELTPELVELGLAREVVNRLSTARKDASLDYADRIRVRYRADDALEAAIDAHRDWIAGETLAVELAPAAADGDGDLQSAPIDDHDFRFHMERA